MFLKSPSQGRYGKNIAGFGGFGKSPGIIDVASTFVTLEASIMIESSSSRILITGVAGFIGSHTAEAFLRLGKTVIGVDNFDPFYLRASKEMHLKSIRAVGGDRFTFIEADITDNQTMRNVFDGLHPDTVVHLAAKAGVRPSIEHPVEYAWVNVQGTAVLLDLANQFGVQRFVMASSSSVYGNAQTVPFNEEQDVSKPLSPYAATKRSCELLAHAHQHTTGMPTACLRFFTVYGPRQRPDLAISKFFSLVSEGKKIPMFGNGETSRDYTYINDIVIGIVSATEKIDVHGYRVWNLGGNAPITLKDLIQTIGRVVGKEVFVESLPMQLGDVDRTYADLTRSRAELGFDPKTTLEEGMRIQWEWMQKNIPT